MDDDRHEEVKTKMAKQQRSVQLPSEVYTLADKVESRCGAKFNRQALAAFIQFLFDAVDEPDPDYHAGPKMKWISLAVAVERGDLSLTDIPLFLLDRAIEKAEATLLACARKNPITLQGIDEETARANVERLRTLRSGWRNNIEDLGGPAGAIDFMLSGCFPSSMKGFTPTEDDSENTG